MVAKGLVVRTIGDLVAEVPVGGSNDESVVVLVGWFLAHDVLLRNPDGESDCLGLEVLMVARRPVGAPAGTQAGMVGELLGIFHVDDARREAIVADIAVEEHIDIGIAMASILGEAYGHGDGGLIGIGLPVAVDQFDDGAQRTIGDDALSEAAHGFDHRGLLSVPATEGAKSEGVTHPQHIVAIAGSLLLLGGIELGFLQFEPFLELAVDIRRLALIEVDADGVVLALEVDTVVVLDMIGVSTIAARRDCLNKVVVLVLLLHFAIAQEHVSIDTGRIGLWAAEGIISETIRPRGLGGQVDEKAEFIVRAVLIEVVELTGNLFVATSDQGIGDTLGAGEDNRDISTGDIGSIGNLMTAVDVGLSLQGSCCEDGRKDHKLDSFHNCSSD